MFPFWVHLNPADLVQVFGMLIIAAHCALTLLCGRALG